MAVLNVYVASADQPEEVADTLLGSIRVKPRSSLPDPCNFPDCQMNQRTTLSPSFIPWTLCLRYLFETVSKNL